MKLYLRDGEIYTDPVRKIILKDNDLVVKRGSNTELQVACIGDEGVFLPSSVLHMGFKPLGDYAVDSYTVYAWADTSENGSWNLNIFWYTEPLESLFSDNPESVSLQADLIWMDGENIIASKTISITVMNCVTTPNGVLPDPAPGIKFLMGPKGDTPVIGKNGNWWINGQDTHVPAVTDLSDMVKLSELDKLMDERLVSYTQAKVLPEDDYNALPIKRENNLYALI